MIPAESAISYAQKRLDNFDAFIGGLIPSFTAVFASFIFDSPQLIATRAGFTETFGVDGEDCKRACRANQCR